MWIIFKKLYLLGLLHILQALPLDRVTHEVEMEILVDEVSKGILHLGLFYNEAPKSVTNFLQHCLCDDLNRLEQLNISSLNCTE
jgi:hypothetical protein